MKMHGEAAAFVPRNPCAIVVKVSEVEDTLKRLKTPQSRKKPVIVAGVTEILVIPHPYNQFFKGYLIYANEERVIPPGGTIIPTGEVKNKQVNARNWWSYDIKIMIRNEVATVHILDVNSVLGIAQFGNVVRSC